MATDARIPALEVRAQEIESKAGILLDEDLGLHTLPMGFYGANSDNIALASGTVLFARLPPPPGVKTISHIHAHVGQTESATETDQSLGLYRKEGANLVRLGVSGASTTLFEVDDDPVNAELGTPVVVGPSDELWAAVLSVATTAGTLVGFALTGVGAATTKPATTSHPIRAYTLAAQTALDATEAISGMTAVGYIPWLFAQYETA